MSWHADGSAVVNRLVGTFVAGIRPKRFSGMHNKTSQDFLCLHTVEPLRNCHPSETATSSEWPLYRGVFVKSAHLYI